MTALKFISLFGGIAVVLYDVMDLVRALIVPRPNTSGPVVGAGYLLRKFFRALASRARDFTRQDLFLATSEPIVLLFRLGVWLALGVAGFGLIIWGTGKDSFGHSFIDSGSSVFTLGFATPPGTVPAVIAFMAAAFGLIVVALQIAYLPSLYDAFNRREILVTMLESRAGTPAWGPEILARHQLVSSEGNLPALYREWERWAADVAESHSTYPALLWFRSPHPANSWIVGLVAIMDSAALLNAVNPSSAPIEAKMCIRMGFICLRDIARTLRVPYDPDPRPDDPIELTYEEFLDAIARLDYAGVPTEVSPQEAWPHFKGWRVNYESIAYRLADIFAAPPAPWTGVRRANEHRHLFASTLKPLRPIDRQPDHPEGTARDRPPEGPS